MATSRRTRCHSGEVADGEHETVRGAAIHGVLLVVQDGDQQARHRVAADQDRTLSGS